MRRGVEVEVGAGQKAAGSVIELERGPARAENLNESEARDPKGEKNFRRKRLFFGGRISPINRTYPVRRDSLRRRREGAEVAKPWCVLSSTQNHACKKSGLCVSLLG